MATVTPAATVYPSLGRLLAALTRAGVTSGRVGEALIQAGRDRRTTVARFRHRHLVWSVRADCSIERLWDLLDAMCAHQDRIVPCDTQQALRDDADEVGSLFVYDR